MGIGQLGGGFKLDGFGAGQSAELACRSSASGGFDVVGKDFGMGVEGDFRIVAVGRFEVESISPRFFVALASNGAFEGGGEQFAEGTRAAGGFDELIENFVGVLSRRRSSSAGEGCHKNEGAEKTSHWRSPLETQGTDKSCSDEGKFTEIVAREDEQGWPFRNGTCLLRFISLKRIGLRLSPIEILLVEPLMPVVQRGQLAADEDIFDFSGYVKRVAAGDDDVCDFADLERADLIGEAKHLRRIERDGFETVFGRKAIGDGVCSVLAEAAGEGIVEAGEGDFHSGGDEFGGGGEQAIVGVIFITRFCENGTEYDRDIF